MARTASIFLLAFLNFTALQAPPLANPLPRQSDDSKPPSLEEITASTADSAVLLIMTGASGKLLPPASGFLAKLNGRFVVTSYTAIKDAVNIAARVGPEAEEPATLVAVSKDHLLALLRLNGNKGGTLGKPYHHPLATGDTVYSIANTAADLGGAAAAKITTTRRAQPPAYLTVSPPFPASHNGAAVVSCWGELLGFAGPADDGAVSRIYSLAKIGSLLVEIGLAPRGAVKTEDDEPSQGRTSPPGEESKNGPGGVPGGVPGEVPGSVSNVVTSSEDSHESSKPNPKIIRKGGGILGGEALRRAEPLYPPLAKSARVTGAVIVEITIDEGGYVISAHALSGHPLLRGTAEAAARGWLFAPTKLSGDPVKVIGTITFNFEM